MSVTLKLGVNIDHVATVRQARGTLYPDPLEASFCCKAAGADSITIHLREDRRHIIDSDVYRLTDKCPLPINLEMANAEEIVQIALEVKPAEVCLVPEKREELTTEGGLDVINNFDAIQHTVTRLMANGTEVSLFVEADKAILQASYDTGARVVELHTGAYCDAEDPAVAATILEKLIAGSEFAHSIGLKVNAGHGINLENLKEILKIPHLDTLNIGHSIVARALFVGMENAVKEMLDAMAEG